MLGIGCCAAAPWCYPEGCIVLCTTTYASRSQLVWFMVYELSWGLCCSYSFWGVFTHANTLRLHGAHRHVGHNHRMLIETGGLLQSGLAK